MDMYVEKMFEKHLGREMFWKMPRVVRNEEGLQWRGRLMVSNTKSEMSEGSERIRLFCI